MQSSTKWRHPGSPASSDGWSLSWIFGIYGLWYHQARSSGHIYFWDIWAMTLLSKTLWPNLLIFAEKIQVFTCKTNKTFIKPYVIYYPLKRNISPLISSSSNIGKSVFFFLRLTHSIHILGFQPYMSFAFASIIQKKIYSGTFFLNMSSMIFWNIYTYNNKFLESLFRPHLYSKSPEFFM